MTRDELRTAIQETVDSTRCDSMMALAATNAIMGLIDRYSVGILQEAYTGPRTGVFQPPTEHAALAWLKARK